MRIKNIMKFGTIAITALLTTQSFAMQESNYVGIDVGSSDVEFTMKASGINDTYKDDGGSQTFKIGHQYEDGDRANAFIHNINADGADLLLYGVGYDYFFIQYDIKPFVGVMAGYGSYDLDDIDMDIDGFFYGAQAGLNYQINDSFSVEAGYRFLKTNMNDSISNVDFEVDNIKNWFVGANYHF